MFTGTNFDGQVVEICPNCGSCSLAKVIIKNWSCKECLTCGIHFDLEGDAQMKPTTLNRLREEELKPCPFCGSQAQTQRNHAGGIYIFCNDIHCDVNPAIESPEEWQDKVVIEHWNTRVDPVRDELFKALEAAQEELRLIRMKDSNAVYDPLLRTITIPMAIANAKK